MAANITKKTLLKEEIRQKHLNLSQTKSLDLISILQETGDRWTCWRVRRGTVSKTSLWGSGANDLCLQQVNWKEKVTEMKGTDFNKETYELYRVNGMRAPCLDTDVNKLTVKYFRQHGKHEPWPTKRWTILKNCHFLGVIMIWWITFKVPLSFKDTSLSNKICRIFFKIIEVRGVLKRNRIGHEPLIVLWALKVCEDSLFYSLGFCMLEISHNKTRTMKGTGFCPILLGAYCSMRLYD